MAGTITSAFCTSFKEEMLSAGHNFNATVTPTATTNSTTSLASVSNMVGVVVGMSISGTGIPSGTVVAAITSATALTLSKAATASASGVTMTISGDQFYCALITGSPSASYGASNVNYQDIVGNSDEVSGAGYTTGGFALTNVTPADGSGVAWLNFSPNPSWTSCSFSTLGFGIYNSSIRVGGASGASTTGAGRLVAVFNTGLTTLSSATFTIVLPSATSSSAILRIS